jgi:hypothetical protein
VADKCVAEVHVRILVYVDSHVQFIDLYRQGPVVISKTSQELMIDFNEVYLLLKVGESGVIDDSG